MGEAIYYMKAVWNTPPEAEEAKPKVEEFLNRMHQAEDMWRETRNEGDHQAAYEALKSQFPEVFEVLHITPPGDPGHYDWRGLNFLAGLLDSPYDEECWEIEHFDNEVRFSGEVWHFANWDPLAGALKETFGAKLSGWVSDEYVYPDFYSLIALT